MSESGESNIFEPIARIETNKKMITRHKGVLNEIPTERDATFQAKQQFNTAIRACRNGKEFRNCFGQLAAKHQKLARKVFKLIQGI